MLPQSRKLFLTKANNTKQRYFQKCEDTSNKMEEMIRKVNSGEETLDYEQQ